ncbi:hypothetical protein [Arthrobacter woluwensis]|uniref:hypothetical protein n=1 Tax=Arthrobacter woluwensis TaxID=156980 RepID=UPI003826D286
MSPALFPGMEPMEPPEPEAPPALRTFIYETIDDEHVIEATSVEFYTSGHVVFLDETYTPTVLTHAVREAVSVS